MLCSQNKHNIVNVLVTHSKYHQQNMPWPFIWINDDLIKRYQHTSPRSLDQRKVENIKLVWHQLSTLLPEKWSDANHVCLPYILFIKFIGIPSTFRTIYGCIRWCDFDTSVLFSLNTAPYKDNTIFYTCNRYYPSYASLENMVIYWRIFHYKFLLKSTTRS